MRRHPAPTLLLSLSLRDKADRLRLDRLRKGLDVRILGRIPSADTHRRLTRRQTQVLQHLAVGMTAAEIAARLGVSIKTIETHRTLLMERLGIRRVPRLVRYALRAGLVPLSWLLG